MVRKAIKKESPKRLGKDVRRRQIQTAAKMIFMEKCYHACTVEEIAKKANVAKGTIYLYYKSKEDLYVALVMPGLKEGARLLAELEEDLENIKKKKGNLLMRLGELMLKNYEFDPDGVRILQAFQQGNLFSDLSKDILDQLNKQGLANYATGRRIIKKGVDLGLLPPMDPIKMVDVLWGLYLGIIQIEEHKLRWTGKDHLASTLEYGFSLLSTYWNSLKGDKSV